MHELSEIGTLLNTHFFDPAASTLGFHVASGHHAVPDHIVMALIIASGLICFAAWLRTRLSVDAPSPLQHVMEVLVEAVQGLMREVIGKDSRRYLPLIMGLALYIFCCNILGQIPGFISPTANLNITAACGISVFLYYNFHGIRKNGVLRYLKHFAGPVWWLAWLLFPIEIVSHLARPFSLSMRLFGNIFAEELIIGSLNMYVFPFLAALPVMFLGLFASTIQAFIFILLTMVYLYGAVEEGHESGHDGAHPKGSSAYGQTHTAAA